MIDQKFCGFLLQYLLEYLFSKLPLDFLMLSIPFFFTAKVLTYLGD